MKTILLAGGLMLTVVYPAQAQLASLNCNHFVGASEDRMISAVNPAMIIREQHPDYCRVHLSATEAIDKWLNAAQICRTRMADYENRVSLALATKQISTSLLQKNCKTN